VALHAPLCTGKEGKWWTFSFEKRAEGRGEERRGDSFPALATSVAMPTVYFGWVMRGAWKVYSGRQGFGFIWTHSYSTSVQKTGCPGVFFLNMLHGLKLVKSLGRLKKD